MSKKPKITRIGDRSIYYGEIQFMKDAGTKKGMCGLCEAKTRKEARRKLRDTIREKYGNRAYKVKQLWKLDPEMEVYEDDETLTLV